MFFGSLFCFFIAQVSIQNPSRSYLVFHTIYLFFFVSFDLYNLLQKEPELLSGNDVLWTFVNFAGEDHTNFKTLVAFLEMLGTLV